MLMRAMFVSVLLHLGMLLSLSRLDAVAPFAVSGHKANALKMTLGGRGSPDSLNPGVQKTASVDAKPEGAVRQSSSPPEHKAEHFNFGRFSRLTVESSNSGIAEPDRSLDVVPSMPLPASAEDIGIYRLSVARTARQFKAYPSIARENGWEGVVDVSVTVPVGLGNPIVSLGHSSGHGILDRQALEMVEQAVSLAVLPAGMRGRSMTISLPVEYRLTDR